MKLLYRLAQTVNQSRFLRSLYQKSTIIIYFHPFYIVKEGFSDENGLNVKPKIKPCDVEFLTQSDLKLISTNPEVPETEDALLKRLSEGCLCIGIKHHDEIAAYMWCNLRQCDSMVIKFDLKEDEAYLMNARTFRPYRGKNLAPFLRIELYRHLRKIGRKQFVSITDFFNIAALRFKKKLNAKPKELYLHITFFKRHKRLVLLKRYKI